jgi:hypothetical protein
MVQEPRRCGATGRPAAVVLDSITQVQAAHHGCVVVAASHGGGIAGAYAAAARLRAVVFNDAGVGKDGAGIASLLPLARMGMAAATLQRRSAPMGDGAHMARSGRVSHVNSVAAACGLRPGMPCAEAVLLLQGHAPQPIGPGFEWVEGRHRLLSGDGPQAVPVLAERGMAAAAVHHASARIGDARSMFASGRLSYLNPPALAMGWRAGMTVRAAIARLRHAGLPPRSAWPARQGSEGPQPCG